MTSARFHGEARLEFMDSVAYYEAIQVDHPNTVQYPNQRMFVVRIRGYAYLVPFVETKQEVFLKTIIPSRKATRIYLDEER